MSIKGITANAMLAGMLFAVYFCFSQILYLEFVTFTVILLALTLPKYNSLWVVITFVLLVWLVYGISLWSVMYIFIYPLFTIVLKLLSPILRKSIYYVAGIAFIMGLLVGNLVDLPFLLFSKEVTMMYVIIGFKTTLVQGVIASISVLIMYEPLAKQLSRILQKGAIYA